MNIFKRIIEVIYVTIVFITPEKIYLRNFFILIFIRFLYKNTLTLQITIKNIDLIGIIFYGLPNYILK
ncbi:hypothetical protein EU95_0084 [Prochlorococcus marinus str. MIT 9201]|uniref:Uncharacterized protein n=1 Tax=Prochlorococcus marinus str. MIT 9201 TaxID=93057 RepID=A0A0A2AC43_PROMR|nr:hypothetical protein EU95_0084 [Prochlorococcus marinus str. MIT 9201]